MTPKMLLKDPNNKLKKEKEKTIIINIMRPKHDEAQIQSNNKHVLYLIASSGMLASMLHSKV